ncbi:hypothetical protein BHE74_00021549 [Ensete ventricosum]|nr:hypothetical protein BHE74_00021549 [Ensete ventricosum]
MKWYGPIATGNGPQVIGSTDASPIRPLRPIAYKELSNSTWPTKDDLEVREMLMMLKTIPPLVSMLDSDDPDLHIDARYALLRSTMSCNPLSFSDLRSKSYLRLQLQEQDTIMKADVVHKMLNLIKSDSFILVSEAIITNFLGLNALDSNKLIISASRVASEGRHALSCSTNEFAILVDVLGWSDAIACQEKASTRGNEGGCPSHPKMLSTSDDASSLERSIAQKHPPRLSVLTAEKLMFLVSGDETTIRMLGFLGFWWDPEPGAMTCTEEEELEAHCRHRTFAYSM